MARVGVINIDLVARTGKLLKPLNQAETKLLGFGSRIGKSVTKSVIGLTKALGAAGVAAVGLGGALGAAGLLGLSVKLAASMEQTQVAFTTFLKSADKAKKLVADLRQFSDVTPFEPEEILQAGKQLLAFGFEAEKITEYLQAMGDVAAGTQKPIADFVDILGKVRASGRAELGDVMRLADRGVPIFQSLAEQLGVAETEVRKLASTGKIGFQDLWDVMKEVTSETGLFGGAMKNLSTTLGGLVSTLKGKITAILEGIGQAIIEGLEFKELTKEISALADEYADDIISATVDGIKQIREVLKETPEWVKDVRAIYQFARGAIGQSYGGAVTLPHAVTSGAMTGPIGEQIRRMFTLGLGPAPVSPGGPGEPMPLHLSPGGPGPNAVQGMGVPGPLAGLGQAIGIGIESAGRAFGDATSAPGQRRFLSGLDRIMSRAVGMVPSLEEQRQFTPYAGGVGALERGSAAAMSAILGTQQRTVEEKQLTEAQKTAKGIAQLVKEKGKIFFANLAGTSP